MEYGRQEAQKPEPDTPALNVDSLRMDALRAEYKERVAALRLSKRQTPARGRLLEQEFIEKGLTAEDVDITPPQPNWQGHRLGDGPPPPR